MQNGFIIAGTNSGCGKTTITIGLMRYFSRKSYKVAPFKVGPDYIDPAFHRVATGQYSHNLDSYMLRDESIQFLFDKYSTNSDISIVEGVMGLYDGLGEKTQGSTAELARLLQLPVILVVNCKALYQSVAAIINGFVQFDKNIRIAGVILNHVYSNDVITSYSIHYTKLYDFMIGDNDALIHVVHYRDEINCRNTEGFARDWGRYFHGNTPTE